MHANRGHILEIINDYIAPEKAASVAEQLGSLTFKTLAPHRCRFESRQII